MKYHLHSSELLLVATFVFGGVSLMMLNEDGRFNMDMTFNVFAFYGLALTALAIWSMKTLKRVSIFLSPLYLFIGWIAGMILGSWTGETPGALIFGVFLVLLLGFSLVHFLLALFFATRTSYRIAILIISAFLITLVLDGIFITTGEIGEKGSGYYYEQYADWRIIGN